MPLVDVDQMLDGNLDDVEAAPDYVEPPTGIYVISIADCDAESFKKAIKEDGKDTGEKEDAVRIRLTRQIDEAREYADDDAVPVKEGSLYSDTYMLDEKGKTFFKAEVCRILGCEETDLQGVTLREMFTLLKESDPQMCQVTTSTNGNGFTNTKTRPVSAAN